MSEAACHPTAIIEDGAELGANVSIGPYCHVGPNVRLSAGVILDSHVVITGRTSIGAACRIHSFAAIGSPPQDLKYRGEDSELLIGAGNRIREYVTMNTGTAGGGMVTRVGDNGLFMAGSHVAHDCQLGDNVILANSVALGGHVVMGDFAVVGGNSAVHQFVRIGEHAIVGGMSGLDLDLVPFASALGERARLAGVNLLGLKKRGFSREDMNALREAIPMVFEAKTVREGGDQVASAFADCGPAQRLAAFVQAESQRGLCRPSGEH